MKNNYANLYLLIICGITNDIPFMNWSILKITYNIENILDLLQSVRAVLLHLSTSSIRYDHFGDIGVDVLHYYWVFYELHKFRFYKICRWKKGKKNEVHFYWSICGSYRDGSCRKDSPWTRKTCFWRRLQKQEIFFLFSWNLKRRDAWKSIVISQISTYYHIIYLLM